MNKRLEIIAKIILILMLIALLFLVYSEINKYSNKVGNRVLCLENKAESYCHIRGLVSLGISQQLDYFRCGIDERTVWLDGYSYLFTQEEIMECNQEANSK